MCKNRFQVLRTLILVFMAGFILLPGAFAQSKKALEEKRQKLIREIGITDKLLKKTTKNREAVYDRYLALQKQIERRKKLIETIELEIVRAEEEINQNDGVIRSLEMDLEHMKSEYGKLVRYSFRQKTLSNPLVFILSAQSLNEAFRRWLFLRKYDQFRKEQARAISATQDMLARKIDGLKSSRIEKEELLASLQGQQATLSSEMTQKNSLLETLSKDETRLKSDLEKKQIAHEQLNKAIEEMIKNDVQKRLNETRKPVAEEKKETSKPQSTKKTETAPAPKRSAPERTVDAALDAEFGNNKGRLPWPVSNGFISKGFGRQAHPTIPTIQITNNGVDIRTDENAPVSAIFRGEVVGVQFIPGHDYTVILQHGSYYTVYSNLAETNLTAGKQVSKGQLIGRVSTNTITGASELHFEIWMNKERVNPAKWIKK